MPAGVTSFHSPTVIVEVRVLQADAGGRHVLPFADRPAARAAGSHRNRNAAAPAIGPTVVALVAAGGAAATTAATGAAAGARACRTTGTAASTRAGARGACSTAGARGPRSPAVRGAAAATTAVAARRRSIGRSCVIVVRAREHDCRAERDQHPMADHAPIVHE